MAERVDFSISAADTGSNTSKKLTAEAAPVCTLTRPRSRIKWRQVKNIPTRTLQPQVVATETTVYVGGGIGKTAMLTIFSYDISSNTWSALPETQTILFGLCMFRGALLTVGGGCENGLTGRVSIYDEHSKVWKDHLFPPMPTERLSLSVFANDSALLACGGATWMVGSEYPEPTAIVEVYRDWCKSWCRMNDLPRPCAAMSSAFIDTMCYLLGSIDPEDKTGPMYTDIRDICSQQQQQHHNNNNHHNHHLHNLHVSSEKADQLKLDWLHLPSPPVTNTSIIATPSYLLAIGGCSQKKKVHMYFKDKRQWWTLASSDLPEDRESCGTVVLKSGEVMVVGGEDCYGVFTDSVYIGNLL